MKLEANLELRFPIWGMFHGATFVDVGNIWFADRHSAPSPAAVFHFDSFYRQLGFDAGIGLRLDIKFAVLRLDWGIQIHNPMHLPDNGGSTISSGRILALNFGVGLPVLMPIWEYGPERAVYRIFHCGGRGCVWSRCRARMIRLHGVRVGRGRIC